ncbi:MAG: hypothetical protein LBN21_11145 [Treponema sp.]|jgi:hypothetical protein|nr:hypothetical protein [Treponema sp.]
MKPSIVAPLLLILSLPVWSQAVFPGLENDPQAAEFARRGTNGAYSWQDLAEIALWASTVQTGNSVSASPGKGQPPYVALITAAAEELASAPDLPQTDREKGEYVLEFIHKKFLKTYSLLQTRVDTILASGRYNCVSSAVLYLIFARSAGLDVQGVMTKDHAFIAVNIDGNFIDVETTNPYGFDPGNRKDFHDGFGKVTGFAYVPANNYRDRSSISPIELVSLILSNRIADLEKQRHFGEAVPLAVCRAGLLAGRQGAASSAFFEDPQRDLVTRISNYGASLIQAGKENDALRWAVTASTKYPGEDRLNELTFAAMNNSLVKLMKQGRIAEARDLLTAHAAQLRSEKFDQLETMIIDTELLDRASKIKETDEAETILAAIDRAAGKNQLSPERAGELRTFAVEKTAALLAAAGSAGSRTDAGSGRRNWPAAIKYIEAAAVRYGSNRQLEKSLQNYRNNWAAEFHNSFASAYNKKNFDEAARILGEGLNMFPDNRQLLSDKNIIDKTGKQ